MNMQRIVTVVLLLFVAVSAGYLAWDGAHKGDAPVVSDQPAGAVAATGDPVVVVYYFHGTNRCHTCRTIEAFTREAVETAFGAELETGEMVLRTVNIEEPGNEHFVEDYELALRSVVLVEVVDGKDERWQRLDEVWNLVGDKAAFVEYIVDHTTDFVRGQG